MGLSVADRKRYQHLRQTQDQSMPSAHASRQGAARSASAAWPATPRRTLGAADGDDPFARSAEECGESGAVATRSFDGPALRARYLRAGNVEQLLAAPAPAGASVCLSVAPAEVTAVAARVSRWVTTPMTPSNGSNSMSTRYLPATDAAAAVGHADEGDVATSAGQLATSGVGRLVRSPAPRALRTRSAPSLRAADPVECPLARHLRPQVHDIVYSADTNRYSPSSKRDRIPEGEV